MYSKYLSAFLFCFAMLSTQKGISQAFFDYQFEHQIEKNFKKKGEYALAAQRYAMIGRYEEALKTADLALPNDAAWEKRFLTKRALQEVDSVNMATYELRGATSFIVEQARKTRIVVINEDEHQPLHRAFTQKLLAELKQEGYQYLALETMGYFDTMMVKRGYPILPTGFSFREAQMGKLARNAVALGYKPFAYEKRKMQTDAKELAQAKNLKSFLEANKNAKIVVYCNTTNAYELPHDTLRYARPWGMAYHLKQLTGINPLTIDQTLLTERASEAHESPYFRWISNRFTVLPEPPVRDSLGVFSRMGVDSLMLDSLALDSVGLDSLRGVLLKMEADSWQPEPIFLIKEASVLAKQTGEGFNGGLGVDVCVFHPRTRYEHKRPTWLLGKDEEYFRLDAEFVTISFPCMVRVYNTNEANEKHPVPVDIVMLEDENDATAFILKKGKYIFQLENDLGESDERELDFE